MALIGSSSGLRNLDQTLGIQSDRVSSKSAVREAIWWFEREEEEKEEEEEDRGPVRNTSTQQPRLFVSVAVIVVVVVVRRCASVAAVIITLRVARPAERFAQRIPPTFVARFA